jgi:hypothetical protein
MVTKIHEGEIQDIVFRVHDKIHPYDFLHGSWQASESEKEAITYTIMCILVGRGYVESVEDAKNLMHQAETNAYDQKEERGEEDFFNVFAEEIEKLVLSRQ